MRKLTEDKKIKAAGGTLPYCLKELKKHLFSDLEGKTQEAFLFAALAHQGQYRKGSGLDYIIHPTHVACILAKYTDPTPELVQAALLHDTIEDTKTSYGDIKERFGAGVANLVSQLTTTNRPGLKRAEKVNVEAERLAAVLPEAQDIKRCDMYSNVRGMFEAKPDFAPQYAGEKLLMHNAMQNGNPQIKSLLDRMFRDLEVV